ncbi:MAG: SH3 domain-containing protein [Caldilineaceae bacterium]
MDTLPSPTATPAASAEAPTAAAPTSAPNALRLVVNSPLVNVRAGPGTTYQVLATVERGQEYNIIGKNGAGDWWRFCCINDEPAWVIGELVDVDGDAESAPVSEDTPADAPTTTPRPPRLVVNAPLVNVRTGPGTNYTVLTTVERGQAYDIIGKNATGDWWRFCCINDEPAWVTGELVTTEGAAALARSARLPSRRCQPIRRADARRCGCDTTTGG